MSSNQRLMKTEKKHTTPIVSSALVRPRFDMDKNTGEAREWRLIAKKDIEGGEWTFPRGKRLRGFKDYRDNDWRVWPFGQENAFICCVPESHLKIIAPVKHRLPQWPAETTGSKALADVRAKWPNASS